MIKAYLFDMNGTLANSEVYYLEGAKNILKTAGREITNEELLVYMSGVAIDNTFKFFGSVLHVNKEKAKEVLTIIS